MTNKSLPERLYAFLPKECLNGGVKTGGWDPRYQVVPAFDPDQKDTEMIKQSFGKNGRVLVEIVGTAKEYFMPRLTGPEMIAQGIYASTKPVSEKYLREVA